MALFSRGTAKDLDDDGETPCRRIIDGALDHAILTTDPAGLIDGWSPGAATIFGWTADEIIGQPLDITFTPEDRAAGVPDEERITARSQGFAPNVRWHVGKAGGRVFIDGTMRVLREDDGRVTGFVKIGQDVTDRKIEEDELRESEAGLRNLAETLEERVASRTAELSATNRALVQEIRERELAEEMRTTLLRLLITAEENERGRISRELHDHMGQQLTGLLLGLRVLEREPSAEARQKRIQQLADLASTLSRDLHSIALELRPPALDNLGLERALRSHLEEWGERHAIACDFQAAGLAHLELTSEVETTLYRIMQEALTNVSKHARARRVSLVLERRGAMINAILEDDGVGLAPEDSAGVPEPGRRLGLRGMRERLALLGGELEIESTPGSGTTLFARIPLERAQDLSDPIDG